MILLKQYVTTPLSLEFPGNCVSENTYPDYSQNSVAAHTILVRESFKLFSCTVANRSWEKLSAFDRCLDISIPEITASVADKGAVFVYMSELGKHISLPLTYYQLKYRVCFLPSYSKGHVYINILGNFIINVRTNYTFKILILDHVIVKELKDLDWRDYDAVCAMLEIKEESGF